MRLFFYRQRKEKACSGRLHACKIEDLRLEILRPIPRNEINTTISFFLHIVFMCHLICWHISHIPHFTLLGMSSYTLDYTAGGWSQQEKFTLPSHLSLNSTWFSPTIRALFLWHLFPGLLCLMDLMIQKYRMTNGYFHPCMYT